MDLNKQPSDIAEALALASAWNAKHVARIAELEAELAEARKDSERLAWAWANPEKFAEAQRTTPPDRTGRQQIDSARGEK